MVLDERRIFAKRIEELKVEKNFSYNDLAKLTGISASNINRYVTNLNMKVPVDNVKKIARAFDVDPAYMLGYVERSPFYEREDADTIIKAIIEELSDKSFFCEDRLFDILDYIRYIKNKELRKQNGGN